MPPNHVQKAAYMGLSESAGRLQSSVEPHIPYHIHAPSPGNPQPPMASPSAPTAKFLLENAPIEGKILGAEDDTVSRRLVQRMIHISGYKTRPFWPKMVNMRYGNFNKMSASPWDI